MYYNLVFYSPKSKEIMTLGGDSKWPVKAYLIRRDYDFKSSFPGNTHSYTHRKQIYTQEMPLS